MARQRHLPKAPIREAVLDVGIKSARTVEPARLRDALKSLGGWPEIRDVKSDPPAPANADSDEADSEDGGVIGVRGLSPDSAWAVDFRQDGVTFRRQAPYPSWAEFSQAARPVVEGFLASVKPDRLVRLGLRYSNHFRLPNRDPRDYFGYLPSLPDSLGLTVRRLLSLVAARDAESGFSLEVTHFRLDDLEPERTGYLLGIGVSSDNGLDPEVDRMWGVFEQLREFKNRVFFELITDRNARLHE